MSDYKYFLSANDDRASIVVIKDGSEIFQADQSSHSNINQIVQAALANDPDIFDLFDVSRAVETRFSRLTSRITVVDDEVKLDGDPAPRAISDAIVRHIEAGTEQALVNFLDRLATNPSQDSIQQLYPWLEANGANIDGEEDGSGFTITEEGFLIAYKGVAKDGEGNLVSVYSGRARVDDEEVTGQIPNPIGAVVEMPRSEVTANSAVGCSTGLHAGTYAYATGWARGALLEVLIDPRDVVSVPTDCSAQKLRVSRYTVLDVIDAPHTVPVRGYDPVEAGADWRDDLGWGDGEGDEPEPDGFEIGDDVEVVDNLDGELNDQFVGEFGVVVGFTGDRVEVRLDSGIPLQAHPDELAFA
jgi:hypothetical protein